MKKQIKLYFHHNIYEPITYTKRTGVLGFFINIIKFIWFSIVWVCFAVGSVIMFILNLPVVIAKSIPKIPSALLSIASKIKTPKFQKTIAVFTLLAIIAAAGVHGLRIIADGQNIKGQVLGASDIGIGYLEDAKNSLAAQNTDAAQANFSKALEQFQNSQTTLDSTNVALRTILTVVPQKQDADHLLAAAEHITQAAIKGTQLIAITNTMKLSAIGLNGGASNKKTLEQVQSLLNDSVALADQAAGEINSVNITSIPENYRPAFVSAKDVAVQFQSNASSLKEVCSLLFNILLGQKNVLLLFENNNELRANGGFIGTVGTAKLQDGALNALDIRSVYDWDGQLKEKILPPQPMFAVNNQWFMRDSNWFASFPESANRISALYEKEGGETPDLIVVMTPDVILDMLDKTGPITLPQHNITLTRENFVEQTQVATSVTYDKTINEPKQFLADFFPALMEQLGSHGGIINFLEIFQKNLFEKNVLLYSRDSDLQSKISAFNWGGELRSSDRDYLSVVNSNLGGTKTDRDMIRSIDLNSQIASDGTVTNTLKYTAQNPAIGTDQLNNKSFVRFYVPLGAHFVSSNGFDNNVVLPRISEDGYSLDEKVQEWQKNVSQDTVSGTFEGTEAGKSWFGNWLDVPSGQSKTVTLTYTLPFKVNSLDRYSLLLQKQVGSLSTSLHYTLNFDGRNSLWTSNNSAVQNSTLRFDQPILTDIFVGVVLQKQ